MHLAYYSPLLSFFAHAASGQTAVSQVGREVAIPAHPQDGQEFNIPLAQLIGRICGGDWRIESWSLTRLQQRLVKTGGRLVKHARYYWLLLAEGHLNRRRFGAMLGRLALLPVPAG